MANELARNGINSIGRGSKSDSLVSQDVGLVVADLKEMIERLDVENLRSLVQSLIADHGYELPTGLRSDIFQFPGGDSASKFSERNRMPMAGTDRFENARREALARHRSRAGHGHDELSRRLGVLVTRK